MATIQSKKKPVIQKGAGYFYNPETFSEFAYANFTEVVEPEELLEKVKPYEYRGRQFIWFDTETHPHYAHSHLVPKNVVRRWVGSGKKAVPQDYPFCISVCDGVNAYTIYDTIENGFKKFKKLAPLFENPLIEKVAHNTKYDMHMFANAGLRIVGRLHDTVVLSKLANENRMSFQLRDLAAKKKGGIIVFEHMVDSYKQINKVSDYRQIPRLLLTQYANADVWNCCLVFLDEYEKLVEDGLEELYDKEMELMVALYSMERRGMPTDSEYEKPLKAELQKLTDDAEAEVYRMAGRTFNINSGKQLYDVLLNSGVSPALIKMTEKGNPVLDKDALAKLAELHGVKLVENILEFRKYEKLLGTYAEGIYDQKDAEGRVHCSINQTEATTGRMSITKPALQTLPKKDKRIRRAFIPELYSKLWFMDLDQVEYRLYAHYAKIPALLEAIKNGYDVHAATAAMLFHRPLEEFIEALHAGEKQAEDARGKGKTVNFALIYGVGKDHLAEILKCTVTEAEQLKYLYFAQLPEAKIFINTVYQVIKSRGFVKNFYGRRRRLASDDCYKAPNALIQGCAADYIKEKMVDIYKYLMYHKLKSTMRLVVHDEVAFNIVNEEQHIAPELRWLMSEFEMFRCPITAGVEYGEPSWGQKVEPDNFGFKEPVNKEYKSFNVFDGHVFDINREAA